MKIKFIFFAIFLLIDINTCYSQVQKKRDTLYYLLDTNRIPAKDRMISSYTGLGYIFYEIQCPCLKHGDKPTFRCAVDFRKKISKKVFANLSCIGLVDLITKVKQYPYNDFKEKYTVFFIQPDNEGFIISKAFLEEQGRQTIIDYDTVSDTSKKKKP